MEKFRDSDDEEEEEDDDLDNVKKPSTNVFSSIEQ